MCTREGGGSAGPQRRQEDGERQENFEDGLHSRELIRGAVKIVVEDVLRVRMVYVAIYLNIDYASG